MFPSPHGLAVIYQVCLPYLPLILAIRLHLRHASLRAYIPRPSSAPRTAPLASAYSHLSSTFHTCVRTAPHRMPVPVLVPAPMLARLIRAHTPRAPIVRVRPRTASLVPHAHSHLHPHFMLAPIPHCTPLPA
ncbi:hypothetical protein A0H81_14978 [Grifola frondosa]|uniref:Uncharacterized protein n=1 Tax=Grifola frondosa TaxID=5627 RepID=A0A1C7LJS5_GRIFR|nr:hypothetical protein A0H81_14978 [Grifola frondosa]